jgi:hypothetical protein
VSNDPHIYPGDVHKDGPVRRRSDEEIERELRVDHQHDRKPGGAEGGEESLSADVAPGAPADDQAPAGDTDQHSDSSRAG